MERNNRKVTVSGQSVKALRIQILTVSGLQLVSLCEENGHRWRPREDTCNLVTGRSELGLVEGADAAPTKIQKTVEVSERRGSNGGGSRETSSRSIRGKVC